MVVIKSIKEDSSKTLSLAYKDRDNGDLVIINKDKRYNVHKTILCYAIPHFATMFSSEMKEATSKEIILDHPIGIFDMIIDWAYCQPIEITEENVFELYHLANYLNIHNLALECLNILFDSFSDQPMLEIDYWRRQVAVVDIGKILERYICLNFRAIISTQTFLTYDVDTIDYIISCDKLNVDDEIEVFYAITDWISQNVEEKLVHLPKLLTKLHWSSINCHELTNKITSNQYVQKNKETHPIIMSVFGLLYLGSPDSAQSLNLKLDPRPPSGSTTHLCCLTNVSETKKKVEILDDLENVHTICTLDYDPSLVAQRLQHLHISEHFIASDYILQIDWKNRRWNHFKDDKLIISKLFENEYEFEKKRNGKVRLKKGFRSIELAPVLDIVDYIRSVTPCKSYFYAIGKSAYSDDTMILLKFDPMRNEWAIVGFDSHELYQEYEEKDSKEIKHVLFKNHIILFLNDYCSIYDFRSASWGHQRNLTSQMFLKLFCIHQSRLVTYDFSQHVLHEFDLNYGEFVATSKRQIKVDIKPTELFSLEDEFLNYLGVDLPWPMLININ